MYSISLVRRREPPTVADAWRSPDRRSRTCWSRAARCARARPRDCTLTGPSAPPTAPTPAPAHADTIISRRTVQAGARAAHTLRLRPAIMHMSSASWAERPIVPTALTPCHTHGESEAANEAASTREGERTGASAPETASRSNDTKMSRSSAAHESSSASKATAALPPLVLRSWLSHMMRCAAVSVT